jgi:hypothetical protein
MLKILSSVAAAAAAIVFTAVPAFAGSPHFVGTPTFTTTDSSVTVTAKEAGLGDESQIHIVVSGTAQCVNPGGNDPQAANKVSFSQAQDEPVQNGKSDYSVTVPFGFKPSCSPPMSVQVTALQVEDTGNNLVVVLVP